MSRWTDKGMESEHSKAGSPATTTSSVARFGAVAVMTITVLSLALMKSRGSRRRNKQTGEKDRADVLNDAELALTQRELYSSLSEVPVRNEDGSIIVGNSHVKQERIPCALLCGPLGSGKTTTLRHLLREIKQSADFTCGVIVNDFADLGVDVDTIKQDDTQQEGAIFGVSEGCCCCMHPNADESKTMRDTLALLRKRADIDCVIVETSGLSEAAGARAQLSRFTRLDAVIGLVDANAFPPKNWAAKDVQSFAQTCDSVIVNKCDVCSLEEMAKIDMLLRTNGARDIRFVKFGRIPITAAFKVDIMQAAQGELGTALDERKASTRYRLRKGLEGDESVLDAINVSSIEAHTHLSKLQWRVYEHSSGPVGTLADLQDVVCLWNSHETLQRAKGRIWLKSFTRALDFQYSGRCRLQLTAVPGLRGTIAKATRIAIVSTDLEHDFHVCLEQRLCKGGEEAREVLLARVNKLRDWLSENHLLTVVANEVDQTSVRFRINCRAKFGFTEDDLLVKFGVNVVDVNREFHARCNCAGGPLLVAFDGEDCYISPGILLDLNQAIDTLGRELEETVALKFAVVKKHCRCDT